MKIFAQEKADGLEEVLKASASISYASVAVPCDSKHKEDARYLKSIASFSDEDLYYVQSILVSSSWNKNDDIFDKAEVWKAKHTPEDKPTNLEHDESTIVGHIVSNWPITEDGILIDDNTPIENLPEKYHILTGSVIYKGFSDPELQERSQKLISEIDDGTKYVSMECFFKGFDYGLLDKSTGKYQILDRNDATAYLTKFLRAYGGVGEHENYKIGRVLRNITFTGKGFVNKPANEDSIIFSKNLIVQPESNDNNQEKNEEIVNSGVLNFQSNIQSETLIMNSATEESKMENTAATETTVTETQTVEVNAAELTSKIEELTKANESLKAEIEQIKLEAAKKSEEDSKKKEEDMKKDEEMKKVKSELDVALETIAAYKAKEEDMAKKEKKNKRVASLVEAGLTIEIAEATVDKFESLDDEAFTAMTSLVAAKKSDKKNEKDEKPSDEPDADEDDKAKKKASVNNTVEADPSVLETAEVEANVNLGVGSDDAESALESTRAALVEFVCSKLGKKTNK